MQRRRSWKATRRRAVDVSDLAELKQRERETWARGDYAAIACDMFWEVGPRIVARVALRSGERVLDIACGTGNAAIRAAEAGGRVVGLDLTPELFEAGEKLASNAGVEVEWVEGDAEALPFDDDSFDIVLSTFGCMFAPRHDRTARELARVLRPGGRMGLTSWTPQSSLADLMRALLGALPPTPDFVQPPPLWGSEQHVQTLFEGTAIELEFAREAIEFRFDSIESALEIYETKWGPFIEARELLEPQGLWSELRSHLGAVLERHNLSSGFDLRFPGEYLVVVGRS